MPLIGRFLFDNYVYKMLEYTYIITIISLDIKRF